MFQHECSNFKNFLSEIWTSPTFEERCYQVIEKDTKNSLDNDWILHKEKLRRAKERTAYQAHSAHLNGDIAKAIAFKKREYDLSFVNKSDSQRSSSISSNESQILNAYKNIGKEMILRSSSSDVISNYSLEKEQEESIILSDQQKDIVREKINRNEPIDLP